MTNDKDISELTDRDIIEIIREEWDNKLAATQRVSALNESTVVEIDTKYKKANGVEKDVITSGLKVRHKESGLMYTVDSFSLHDVTLEKPSGEVFTISADTFEKEYDLD